MSATVLIDYQNIHLTAHDRWAPPGTPKHESLVHPLYFSNQLLALRNRLMMPRPGGVAEGEQAELSSVIVYRGLPSNRHSPNMYRRSQAQRSEWTRDRRVEVNYRPLRYYWQGGEQVAQEKGVDVLIALRLLREAGNPDGLLILATHDTDLEPALDWAQEVHPQKRIETAGWKNSKRLKTSPWVWHTALDSGEFVRSRDRRIYT